MTKRRLVIGGVGLLTILAAGILVYGVRLLGGPAEGTVMQTATSQTTKAEKPHGEPGTYHGKYISFTYPANYEKLSTAKNAGLLEVVGYYSTDHSSKHIAIAVVWERLDNDSGVNYRKSHPELYHQVPDTRRGLIFYKNTSTGSERTAFVAHEGMVVSIAITCPFQTDLTDDSQTVLRTLVWKQ